MKKFIFLLTIFIGVLSVSANTSANRISNIWSKISLSNIALTASTIAGLLGSIKIIKDYLKGPMPKYEVISQITKYDVIQCSNRSLFEIIASIKAANSGNSLAQKTLPGGILLHGEPGTGKTQLAYNIASELKAVLIKVSAKDISTPEHVAHLFREARERTNAWSIAQALDKKQYGEVFRQLKRGVYNRWVCNIAGLQPQTENIKRVVLFIDEIDCFAKKRSAASDNSLTNAFLAELGDHKNKDILVVGATNFEPRELDEAFVRPGRFTTINIELPNADTIASILWPLIYSHERDWTSLLRNQEKTPKIIKAIAKHMESQRYSGAKVKQFYNDVVIKLNYENKSITQESLVQEMARAFNLSGIMLENGNHEYKVANSKLAEAHENRNDRREIKNLVNGALMNVIKAQQE